MMKNGCPFTSAQWQELEHQSLIFKYMVSGSPIPTDLISSLRRSLDSSIASKLFPRHPIGWGCYEMGFGRKTDPEPGRCRRTDGKKWRCSKEAYPDSKYCERHMHRGRNRSRKPVEVSSTSSSPSPPIPSANNFSISNPTTYSSSLSLSPSLSSPQTLSFHSHCRDSALHHLLRPLSPPPNHPAVTAFSTHSSTQNFLCSGWNRDRRYDHGTKDGRDEQAFFPEASGMGGNLAEPYPPLTMNTCHQSRLQNLDQNNTTEQRQQEQHCFILGTDFQSSKQVKPDKETETHKPLHHFFRDWPIKKTESWLDLAFNSSKQKLWLLFYI